MDEEKLSTLDITGRRIKSGDTIAVAAKTFSGSYGRYNVGIILTVGVVSKITKTRVYYNQIIPEGSKDKRFTETWREKQNASTRMLVISMDAMQDFVRAGLK